MSTARHTPVPWLKYGHLITADDNLKPGLTVTICHMGTLSDNVKHDASEIDVNAKFIERACNSHEDLLAACKALLKVVSAMGIESDSPLWSEEYDTAHIGAREAIAKAGQ